MKKKVVSKILACALAAAMVVSLAACGGNGDESSTPSSSTPQSSTPAESTPSSDETPGSEETPSTEAQAPEVDIKGSGMSKITFALTNDSDDHTEPNAQTTKLIEDISAYVGTPLEFSFAMQTTYYDQLANKLMTKQVADVNTFAGQSLTPEFINAAEQGLFWDLTDYIDDYPNLATIPQDTIAACSYNGKVYGIPKHRDYARNGWAYRTDWAENLGLSEPKTWDEFKNMLYQFTYSDPDGNGQNDTVGLGIDAWQGVWDIMEPWFGVPNTWGIDENGDLVYKIVTPEWKTALAEFRDLYSQGVINDGSNGVPAFEDVEIGKARQELWYQNKNGVAVQVIDDLRKVNDNAVTEGKITEDQMIFKMLGGVTYGDLPLSLLPNGAGMNGWLGISTVNVKTEEQLRQVLYVLDKLNDGDAINLLTYGWEGVTYELDEEGYIVPWTGDDYAAQREAAGVTTMNYDDGFLQCLAYFTAPENAAELSLRPYTSAARLLQDQLYADDVQYCVPNYGLGYVSQTYVDNGSALDAIWQDARLAYIKGEIDEAGLDAAIESWKNSGGDQVTKEMNELYHAAGH